MSKFQQTPVFKLRLLDFMKRKYRRYCLRKITTRVSRTCLQPSLFRQSYRLLIYFKYQQSQFPAMFLRFNTSQFSKSWYIHYRPFFHQSSRSKKKNNLLLSHVTRYLNHYLLLQNRDSRGSFKGLPDVNIFQDNIELHDLGWSARSDLRPKVLRHFYYRTAVIKNLKTFLLLHHVNRDLFINDRSAFLDLLTLVTCAKRKFVYPVNTKPTQSVATISSSSGVENSSPHIHRSNSARKLGNFLKNSGVLMPNIPIQLADSLISETGKRSGLFTIYFKFSGYKQLRQQDSISDFTNLSDAGLEEFYNLPMEEFDEENPPFERFDIHTPFEEDGDLGNPLGWESQSLEFTHWFFLTFLEQYIPYYFDLRNSSFTNTHRLRNDNRAHTPWQIDLEEDLEEEDITTEFDDQITFGMYKRQPPIETLFLYFNKKKTISESPSFLRFYQNHNFNPIQKKFNGIRLPLPPYKLSLNGSLYANLLNQTNLNFSNDVLLKPIKPLLNATTNLLILPLFNTIIVTPYDYITSNFNKSVIATHAFILEKYQEVNLHNAHDFTNYLNNRKSNYPRVDLILNDYIIKYMNQKVKQNFHSWLLDKLFISDLILNDHQYFPQPKANNSQRITRKIDITYDILFNPLQNNQTSISTYDILNKFYNIDTFNAQQLSKDPATIFQNRSSTSNSQNQKTPHSNVFFILKNYARDLPKIQTAISTTFQFIDQNSMPNSSAKLTSIQMKKNTFNLLFNLSKYYNKHTQKKEFKLRYSDAIYTAASHYFQSLGMVTSEIQKYSSKKVEVRPNSNPLEIIISPEYSRHYANFVAEFADLRETRDPTFIYNPEDPEMAEPTKFENLEKLYGIAERTFVIDELVNLLDEDGLLEFDPDTTDDPRDLESEYEKIKRERLAELNKAFIDIESLDTTPSPTYNKQSNNIPITSLESPESKKRIADLKDSERVNLYNETKLIRDMLPPDERENATYITELRHILGDSDAESQDVPTSNYDYLFDLEKDKSNESVPNYNHDLFEEEEINNNPDAIPPSYIITNTISETTFQDLTENLKFKHLMPAYFETNLVKKYQLKVILDKNIPYIDLSLKQEGEKKLKPPHIINQINDMISNLIRENPIPKSHTTTHLYRIDSNYENLKNQRITKSHTNLPIPQDIIIFPLQTKIRLIKLYNTYNPLKSPIVSKNFKFITYDNIIYKIFQSFQQFIKNKPQKPPTFKIQITALRYPTKNQILTFFDKILNKNIRKARSYLKLNTGLATPTKPLFKETWPIELDFITNLTRNLSLNDTTESEIILIPIINANDSLENLKIKLTNKSIGLSINVYSNTLDKSIKIHFANPPIVYSQLNTITDFAYKNIPNFAYKNIPNFAYTYAVYFVNYLKSRLPRKSKEIAQLRNKICPHLSYLNQYHHNLSQLTTLQGASIADYINQSDYFKDKLKKNKILLKKKQELKFFEKYMQVQSDLKDHELFQKINNNELTQKQQKLIHIKNQAKLKHVMFTHNTNIPNITNEIHYYFQNLEKLLAGIDWSKQQTPCLDIFNLFTTDLTPYQTKISQALLENIPKVPLSDIKVYPIHTDNSNIPSTLLTIQIHSQYPHNNLKINQKVLSKIMLQKKFSLFIKQHARAQKNNQTAILYTLIDDLNFLYRQTAKLIAIDRTTFQSTYKSRIDVNTKRIIEYEQKLKNLSSLDSNELANFEMFVNYANFKSNLKSQGMFEKRVNPSNASILKNSLNILFNLNNIDIPKTSSIILAQILPQNLAPKIRITQLIESRDILTILTPLHDVGPSYRNPEKFNNFSHDFADKIKSQTSEQQDPILIDDPKMNVYFDTLWESTVVDSATFTSQPPTINDSIIFDYQLPLKKNSIHKTYMSEYGSHLGSLLHPEYLDRLSTGLFQIFYSELAAQQNWLTLSFLYNNQINFKNNILSVPKNPAKWYGLFMGHDSFYYEDITTDIAAQDEAKFQDEAIDIIFNKWYIDQIPRETQPFDNPFQHYYEDYWEDISHFTYTPNQSTLHFKNYDNFITTPANLPYLLKAFKTSNYYQFLKSKKLIKNPLKNITSFHILDSNRKLNESLVRITSTKFASELHSLYSYFVDNPLSSTQSYNLVRPKNHPFSSRNINFGLFDRTANRLLIQRSFKVTDDILYTPASTVSTSSSLFPTFGHNYYINTTFKKSLSLIKLNQINHRNLSTSLYINTPYSVLDLSQKASDTSLHFQNIVNLTNTSHINLNATFHSLQNNLHLRDRCFIPFLVNKSYFEMSNPNPLTQLMLHPYFQQPNFSLPRNSSKNSYTNWGPERFTDFRSILKILYSIDPLTNLNTKSILNTHLVQNLVPFLKTYINPTQNDILATNSTKPNKWTFETLSKILNTDKYKDTMKSAFGYKLNPQSQAYEPFFNKDSDFHHFAQDEYWLFDRSWSETATFLKNLTKIPKDKFAMYFFLLLKGTLPIVFGFLKICLSSLLLAFCVSLIIIFFEILTVSYPLRSSFSLFKNYHSWFLKKKLHLNRSSKPLNKPLDKPLNKPRNKPL